MNRFIKWLLATAGAFLFNIVCNWFSDGITFNRAFTTVSPVVKWIWDALIKVFTFSIPIWGIIGFGVVFIRLLRIYRFRFLAALPQFSKYRQDVIHTWLWKWKYRPDFSIYELTPYCPTCDVRLRVYQSNHCAYCPNCETKYDTSLQNYVAYDPTGIINHGKYEDFTDTSHIILSKIEAKKREEGYEA